MPGQSTLQIARKLVQRLPKERGDELAGLIQRADNGNDPSAEIQIIKLLSMHENIRHWMKEQSDMQDGHKGFGGGYIPLAGNPSTLFSQKWICPQSGCDQSLPVIQEGEEPPECEKHHREMVRAVR